MNCLYHISTNPNIKTLTIRRPRRWFDYSPVPNIHLCEDRITQRISFGTSIDGCLSGVGNCIKKDIVTVYTPIKKYDKTIKPSFEQVPDAFLTGEVWGLENCEVKPIGKIKILSKERAMKNTGLGYRMPFWNCKWEWVEKVS